MKKRFTTTEKANLIKTVNDLRKKGRTIKESCGEAGITVSNFNYWTACDMNNGKEVATKFANTMKPKGNGKNKTMAKFTAVALSDSDIARLETMIAERETLATQLNALSTTIKTTFEKVRELEKTITY